jgi:hypothetical protein
MPQIWMTCEELAELLDCTAVEASNRVRLERLDWKQSRDGKQRAKLSVAMMGIFFDQLRTIDRAADTAVDKLRPVYALMTKSPDEPNPLIPQLQRSHRLR